MLSFVTAVELMAIAKSCVEREKSFGKIAQGTNCPYEEIFPKLRKNCSEHTWLVPLRQQNAQACTFLRLKTCTSRKIFVPLQSQRILELWQEANVFINH